MIISFNPMPGNVIPSSELEAGWNKNTNHHYFSRSLAANQEKNGSIYNTENIIQISIRGNT